MAVVLKDRQIFEVHATIVDSSGARQVITGYPKSYDSHNQQFNDNIDACLQRAKAEAYKTFGDMLLVTTRQLQTVILQQADGKQIIHLTEGKIAPVEVTVPDPEPEQNNEPQGE